MSPDDTSGGPTQINGPHLTLEQLDELAAQASADRDPEHAEEPDGSDGLLQVHLAGCAACRSALGDQVEVSAWLRRAPTPGPMPSDLVARLDAALAGAAAARPVGGSDGTPERAGAGNVLPMSARSDRTGVLGRLAESRLTKSLVAAAAVVLIGGGAFAAIHRNSSSGSSTGGASSASAGKNDSAAVPGAAPTAVQVRQSGTAYTTANISTEVAKQLAAPAGPPAVQPQGASEATTLLSPAGLRGCLTALEAPAVTPALVDLATFNGKPAAVLVLPGASGGQEIWVVSRTCSPANDGTMLFKKLG